MIDPSEVAQVPMPLPLSAPMPQYPTSDDSDESSSHELQHLTDLRLQHFPSDPSSSLSSRSDHAPENSNHHSPEHESPTRHHKSHHRRSSSVQREMVKQLINNTGSEVKSMRKYLRVAIERLEAETRRAQEAERRALEIAERFRVVNEARQNVQNELTRVTEELRMWQNQFENAQKEILRGRDILKDLEDQRNTAETDAMKYRTMARKLNEEKIVNKAREEGRREGYEEGLKKGIEQGRADGYNRSRNSRRRQATEDTLVDDEALDGGIQPNQAPLAEGSVASEGIPPLEIPTRVPLKNLPLRSGTQFHEHFTPTSTARSLAPAQDIGDKEVAKGTQPPVVHNRPPSVHHPSTPVPPDNWIPELDVSSKRISIPPPHEFITRTGSPYSDTQPLPIPNATLVANYAQVPPADAVFQKTRSSPPSITESVQSSHQSTNLSQYDIVRETNQGSRSGKKDKPDPRRALDRIDEVSSSMEYSPGLEKPIPVPVTFPVASGSADPDWDGSHGTRSRKNSQQSSNGGISRSRGISQGQRQSDDLRYSSNNIEDWRNKTVPTLSANLFPGPASASKPVYPSGLRHELGSESPLRYPEQIKPRSITPTRPRSPGGPRPTTPVNSSHQSSLPHRRTQSLRSSPQNRMSGEEFQFDIVPPSGTPSHTSPAISVNASMLSPNSAPAPLPLPSEPPQAPTEPNTPTLPRRPSLGMTQPPTRGGLPPGFVPMGPPTPASANVPLKAPPIQQARTHPGGLPGGPTWSFKNGPERAPSAQGRQRPQTPQMTYEAAPMPEGIQYPAPPVTRPRDSPKMSEAALDNFSPRSSASQFSAGHHRSLSLNAGATPGASARQLSSNPPPKLRKMPSNESVGNGALGTTGSYAHFDPKQYVDIAALASSEDLLADIQSPMTAANTRANAGMRNASGPLRIPPPTVAPVPSPAPTPVPAPSTQAWNQPKSGRRRK